MNTDWIMSNNAAHAIYNCNLYDIEFAKTKSSEKELFETLLFIPLIPVFVETREEYLIFKIKYSGTRTSCNTTDMALITNNNTIYPLRKISELNDNGNLLCYYYYPAKNLPLSSLQALSFEGIKECNIPKLPLSTEATYTYENRPNPW